jgi:hypothetical protein
MEMTRRQFALSIAAAATLRSSLFEPLSPLGVPRGVVPGRVTWAHDPAAVPGMAQVLGGPMPTPNSL